MLVCLGKPPYERGRRIDAGGSPSGGWVVHGEGEGGATPIFEAFLAPARASGTGGHLKNLYNEYVYFWRWDEIWILHVGGEGRATRREENVFAIQTPVAIAVAGRVGATARDVPATVHYGPIARDRASKLASLAAIESVDDVAWEDCPADWHAPFLPTLGVSWSDLPAVADVFP